jgi:hypothetical protein
MIYFKQGCSDLGLIQNRNMRRLKNTEELADQVAVYLNPRIAPFASGAGTRAAPKTSFHMTDPFAAPLAQVSYPNA